MSLPRLLDSKAKYVVNKGAEDNSIIDGGDTPASKSVKAVPSPSEVTFDIAVRGAAAARRARQTSSMVARKKAQLKTDAWRRSFQNSDKVEPSWVQTFKLLANVDGEVRQDALPHALELIGHR